MTTLEQVLNRERLPFPLQRIGIGGFSLFARVSERLTLKADNPKFFVEDGTPLNDHRIQKPETVRITGAIGDVYESPETSVDVVQALDNNLGLITQYLPRFTGTQAVLFEQISRNAVSRVSVLEDLIDAGAQARNVIGNVGNTNKPLGEQFLDAMEDIHYGNQLISIEMPYRIYENMSIATLTFDRNNTNDGVEFTMEAERFRVADLAFTAVERVPIRNGMTAERVGANPAAALDGQAQTVSDKGAQEGRTVTNEEARSSGLSNIGRGLETLFGDE